MAEQPASGHSRRVWVLVGLHAAALLALAAQWPVLGQACTRSQGWAEEPGRAYYTLLWVGCEYPGTNRSSVEIYPWPIMVVAVLLLAGLAIVPLVSYIHAGWRWPIVAAQLVSLGGLAAQWPFFGLTCLHQQPWYTTGGHPQIGPTSISCEYLRDGQQFQVQMSTVPMLVAVLLVAAAVLVTAVWLRRRRQHITTRGSGASGYTEPPPYRTP